MAGAYGNVGAVIYLVIFSLVDSRAFFFILAGGALISFVVTLFMLEEPKGAFEATLDHDMEERHAEV
jgi:NNP family nitrate/nitrite transporter-like MFS transporter